MNIDEDKVLVTAVKLIPHHLEEIARALNLILNQLRQNGPQMITGGV
jgi:hypothetical protein